MSYNSETFARLENERAQQEAEPLIEKAEGFLETIIEAKESWAGERFPFEQVLNQAGWDWERLHPAIKDEFLNSMGEYLGIDLFNPPEEELIRQYKMEGESETPTEGMVAEVRAFPTKFPGIELHIVKYPEPVGIRYDLVSPSTS